MNQVIMLASVHQLLMGIRSLHGVGDKEPAWIKFEKEWDYHKRANQVFKNGDNIPT